MFSLCLVHIERRYILVFYFLDDHLVQANISSINVSRCIIPLRKVCTLRVLLRYYIIVVVVICSACNDDTSWLIFDHACLALDPDTS